MTKKELVDYIKKEVAAGYDVSYLKNYLIKQGYGAKEVEDAINSIGQKPAKHIEISGAFIAMGILAVIILAIGIFAITRLMAPEETTVTTPTLPQQQGASPIPQITPQTTPAKTLPEVEVQIVPSTPTGLSITQVLNRIPYITVSEAVSLCRRFTGKDKDNCFHRIALEKGSSEHCAEIINIRKRDNCYMSFAYLEDYSVCTEIQDIYLKQSCRELGKLEYNE